MQFAGTRMRLAVAVVVALFLAIFRPFGMSLDQPVDYLVIAGIIPLNFIILTAVHMALSRYQAKPALLGRMTAFGAIVLANFAYLSIFGSLSVQLAYQVALIALLIFAAVWLWVSRRDTIDEVIELRGRIERESKVLRFEDDSGVQSLQIDQSNLLFAEAQSNYVRIVWLDDTNVREQLLRTTLAQVAEFGEGVLLQCHRSYLVNLSNADELDLRGGKALIRFPNGLSAPVSRTFLEAVRTEAAIRPA